MKSNRDIKFPFYFIITILLTLGLSISCQSLLAAWTAPTANPPSASIKSPIYNEGTASNLAVNSQFTVNDNFYVGSDVLAVNYANKFIGINTVNPQVNLHVVGSNTLDSSGALDAGGIVVTGGGTRALSIGVKDDANPRAVYLQSTFTDNANATGALSLNPNGGNVGIGTLNPQAKLHVNGRIKAQNPVDNNDVATKSYVDSHSGGGYSECYVRCAYNNNAGCHSGETRVFLYGSGRGCTSSEERRWVANAKGIAFHCWKSGERGRFEPQWENCEINGALKDFVQCAYSYSDHDSSCAICCK